MHEALATVGSKEGLDVQSLTPANGEVVLTTRTYDLVTRSRWGNSFENVCQIYT